MIFDSVVLPDPDSPTSPTVVPAGIDRLTFDSAGTVCAFPNNPPARSVLHARIAARFHAMMADGFLDEVRRLHARGDLHPDLPAIRAVGYRQLWAHLDGECGLDEAVERGIAATRQFAKRQLTWLRSEPDLNWLDPAQDDLLDAAIAHFRAADNSESQ